MLKKLLQETCTGNLRTF